MKSRSTAPPGTALLARDVGWASAHTAWDGPYMRAREMIARVHSARRPFIGVAPEGTSALVAFLREQGFITEVSTTPSRYSLYLDRPRFDEEAKRPLLRELENKELPLVRLGRWYDGARCALCITGDIDALTLGDYAMRLVGK